jgi:hypothetical protein
MTQYAEGVWIEDFSWKGVWKISCRRQTSLWFSEVPFKYSVS